MTIQVRQWQGFVEEFTYDDRHHGALALESRATRSGRGSSMGRQVPGLIRNTCDGRYRGSCASARDKIASPRSRDGPRSACGSGKQASSVGLGHGVRLSLACVMVCCLAVPGLALAWPVLLAGMNDRPHRIGIFTTQRPSSVCPSLRANKPTFKTRYSMQDVVDLPLSIWLRPSAKQPTASARSRSRDGHQSRF